MNQIFNTDIILETDRLILRFIDKNDYEGLYHNVFSSDNVLKYFLARKFDDIEECKKYIEKLTDFYRQRQTYCFSIVLKENSEVIGMLLQCSTPDIYHNNTEIGYAIGEKYWNKGYTSEALKKVIDYMFEIGIDKLYCSHIKENEASGKVMKKCGMIYEGEKIRDLYYHDKYWDTNEYYILNENIFKKM